MANPIPLPELLLLAFSICGPAAFGLLAIYFERRQSRKRKSYPELQS